MIRILPYTPDVATPNEFVLQKGERCTIFVSRMDGDDTVGEVFAYVQVKAEGGLAASAGEPCQIDYDSDSDLTCRFTTTHFLDSQQPSVTIEAADGPATYRVLRPQCKPIIGVYRTKVLADGGEEPDCSEGEMASRSHLLRPSGGNPDGYFTLTRGMLPARISAWANGDPFKVNLYSVATICAETIEVPLGSCGDCDGSLTVDMATMGMEFPGGYKWEVVTDEEFTGDPVIFLDADDGWHCNPCGGLA